MTGWGANQPQPKTFLVLGDGRHGKDTAGRMLAEITGRPYASSSEFCAQKAVFPLVSDLYPNWRACYGDRVNHRKLWFHAIAAYNQRPGPSLAEEVLVDHGAYIGMRNRAEFTASRHLFDLVLWVDRSEHVPRESRASMELGPGDADIILDNNKDLDHLEAQVRAMLQV
ncbi:MAG: hypothetical protein COB16_06660 [Rhodobacteraceae bacterium]|nr:MAG: hypothetical protein COB16_06660 [Paracoccaceae bacterium]